MLWTIRPICIIERLQIGVVGW